MRGVGGVRKSEHQRWLAKGLELGLLCWGFKGVLEMPLTRFEECWPLLAECLSELSVLNLLGHSKTNAWFMQDGQKAVWSIPYVSVAFFPSLKQNFIAYCSSSRPYCIFEIHQLRQSGFSRVYSNCCCSYAFEPKIIKIGQSSMIWWIFKCLRQF